MTQTFTTDMLQSLLAFPFKDPQWKNKFLTGSLVILASYIVPIIPGILLYGYVVQIMRRIIVERGEPFLPEWNDWDKLFKEGLKLLGIVTIYSLPMLLLFMVGYGLFFMAMFIPPFLLETGNQAAPDGFLVLASIFGSLGGMAFFGLGMLFILITLAVLPVAICHAVATNEFAAAFRLAELWAILRANLANFVVAFAVLLGFWMALSFVLQILFLTIIFCCIYPIAVAPITVYLMIIWSVMFAQVYRDGAEKLRLQTLAASSAA